MAVTTQIFHNFLYNSLHSKNIDFDSDTIKMQLHTSTMALDATKLATWDFHNDLTNECAASGNYATGGSTLTGCSVTLVESTAAPDWTAATAYELGMMVAKVADNAHIYRCIQAGTSHGTTEPVWTTGVGTVQPTDGTVIWAECGSAFIKLTFTGGNSWASSTITARYAVILDTTPGSTSTNPLIAVIDFGADVSTTNGTFTVTPDATYGLIQLPIL